MRAPNRSRCVNLVRLVRAAKPLSVIWRLSRLRDFSELKPEIFFRPMSVTNVKERLMHCKFRKPER
uniref:Uncharacterized protein n=1 Tax=Arundo donax TaxID=35708 RepID=A0A0A9EKS5_ARUDO